jgi:hypothetical protein
MKLGITSQDSEESILTRFDLLKTSVNQVHNAPVEIFLPIFYFLFFILFLHFC